MPNTTFGPVVSALTAQRLRGRSRYGKVSIGGKDGGGSPSDNEFLWILLTFPSGTEASVNCPEKWQGHCCPSGWSCFAADTA